MQLQVKTGWRSVFLTDWPTAGLQKALLLHAYILQYLHLSRTFCNSSHPCWSLCKHFKLLVGNTVQWRLRSERSAWDVIPRAATESSLNAMMSSAEEFQEMRRAKGKALAYSLSWRVMARQNAERKLLMVYTSIFNAFFLALSVFCWGQVWIEASYFTAIRVIIMVSGTVAQWECVLGQSYGDLRLLAVVIWRFACVFALQTLIGNNENQLLVLIIGSLANVTHNVAVWGQQTTGLLKKRLSLDEVILSVVHDYGQHIFWILMKRWKEQEDKEQVSVTHTDMKAHTPAHTHTHTLHFVSTFQFSRLCLYDPEGTGNKKVSISPSYLL